MERLLPKLGPLFSLGVILFAVWDRLIDPPGVARPLPLRAAAVLIGLRVCLPAAQGCPVMLRCAFLYWTYALAVIVCAYLLDDGLLYGLAGITACVLRKSGGSGQRTRHVRIPANVTGHSGERDRCA